MNPRRLPANRTAPAMLSMAIALFTTCGGGGGGGGSTPLSTPLVITTTTLQEGTVGTIYHTSLLAAGGTAPYTWSLVPNSGSLPPEVVLESTGTIHGNVTANGTFSFTIQASDSRGKTASRPLRIDVYDPLIFSPLSMPTGFTNRDYAFALEATGGHAPYAWSVEYGGLPPGLALSTSGVISGKPTQGGFFSFGAKVLDRGARSVIQTVSIAVAELLEVQTNALPEINVGWFNELELHARGGATPYHWSLAAGSGPLPTGLTLVSTGSWGWLTGVATQPGVFPIVVQVSDSLVPPQTATKELTVSVGNQLYFRPDYLPLAVVGRTYREGVKTYGGTPPYTWKLISGALPPGLTFDSSTGEFSGLPEQPAQYLEFGIEVKDSSSPVQIATGVMVLNINPPVDFLPAPLYDAIRAESYGGQPVTARWGKPPYTLRSVGGSLPPGLLLSSTTSDWGEFPITGTATTLGEYRVTYEVSDSSSPPTTASKEFSIRVVTRLDLLTNSLPAGWVGEPYSAQLNAEGGVPPYTWRALYLDPGLSLDPSTGSISGTPRYVGAYGTQFEVQDKSYPPQTAVKYFLPLIAERLVISSKLPPGRPSIPYQVKLGLKGGREPYAWTLTSGSLPEGLIFDPASWLIQGTPTAEGTSSFTFQVTDAGPPVQTVSKSLSLTIASNLGRNDTPATATPISNGTFRASISPYSDPVAGPAIPDHDYYEVTAAPGAIVTIETTADRFNPESFLDSVLEIVDASGNRLSTCRSPLGYYDEPCLNDDIQPGVIQDSHLDLKIPDDSASPFTFYIHVFSFDGNARPDYIYDLTVSGAN